MSLYFEQFKAYLKQNNLSFYELICLLLDNEPDGVGCSSKFYKMPNTEFGIKIINIKRIAFFGTNTWKTQYIPNIETFKEIELTETEDPFNNHHFGQSFASCTNWIYLLRLQHGNPAGKQTPKNNSSPPQSFTALDYFHKRLLEAASFPERSYIDLMNEVIFLNELGFAIDWESAANLLIDMNSERFGLIDLAPSGKNYNDGSSILKLIFDIKNLKSEDLNKNDAIQKASMSIISKTEKACNEVGLNFKSKETLNHIKGLLN